MSFFTVQPLTPDTLADLYALHSDREDAATRLATLRGLVTAGQVGLDRMLVLRSRRGVEGTVVIADGVRVPTFPRFRPDVSAEGMTVLAHAIRERVSPGHSLVLQDAVSLLNPTLFEAAGWVLDERHVMYETDLWARSYRRDPQAVAGGVELLSRPDLQLLLERLGRAGYELPDGWTLVGLADAGEVKALGATGSTPRPGSGSVAVLDMLGVLPEARGRGLGARLYEHLLALAAESHTQHVGGTDAENVPMCRIFEKSGSRMIGSQLIFRLP